MTNLLLWSLVSRVGDVRECGSCGGLAGAPGKVLGHSAVTDGQLFVVACADFTRSTGFGGLIDTETTHARGCVVLCAALCDAGLGWVGWSVHEGEENGIRIYCNKVSYTSSSDCPSYLVRVLGLVVGRCPWSSCRPSCESTTYLAAYRSTCRSTYLGLSSLLS